MRLPAEYLLFLLYREKRSPVISFSEIRRLIDAARRDGLPVPDFNDIVIALTYMKLSKIINIEKDTVRIVDPISLARIAAVLEDPLLHFTVDSKLRDITEQAKRLAKTVIMT